MVVSSTVFDESGVTIRPLFGARSLPWLDVQGIEIHTNPNAAAPGRQPRFIAGGYTDPDSFASRVLTPVVLIMGSPCATYVVALVVIVVRRRAGRHE